jgi:hypothetical protein
VTAQSLADKDLQKYYDTLLTLFSTDGWALVVEEAKRYREPREKVRDMRPEMLQFVQGELAALDWLVDMQERTQLVYDALLEQEGDTLWAEQTGGQA